MAATERRGSRVRKAVLLLLVLLAGPAAARDVPARDAAGQDFPLPRPKPFALRAMHAAPLPVPRPARPRVSLATAQPPEVRPLPDLIEPASPLPQPAEPSACQLRLAEIAAIRLQPPLTGPGQCGAVDVVRLEGILLADKTRIAVNPPALLRCDMAEAVAHWVRDDVAAIASTLGARLAGVDNFDSYDCRGRNGVAGAKLSEHGKANAIDIGGMKLANGRVVDWTDPAVAREARESLRRSACERFKTVLGPGSDSYHETHIHVDLAERRNNYRMCQWDVRDIAEVPLPRPRPAEAAQIEEEEPD